MKSILILMSILASQAYTQEIQDLFKLYKEQNHRLERSLISGRISEVSLKEVKAVYFPSLSAGVSGRVSASENKYDGEMTARNHTGQFDTYMQISQALFDKGILLNIEMAKFNKRGAYLEIENLKKEQSLNFLQSYLNILAVRVQYVYLKEYFDVVREMETLSKKLKLSQTIQMAIKSKRVENYWEYNDAFGYLMTLINNFSSKLWEEGNLHEDKFPHLYYPKSGYNYLKNMRKGDSGRIKHKLSSIEKALNNSYQIKSVSNEYFRSKKAQKISRWPNISLSLLGGVGANWGTHRETFFGSRDYNSSRGHQGYVAINAAYNWNFGRKYEKQRHDLLVNLSRNVLEDVILEVKSLISEQLTKLYYSGYYTYRFNITSGEDGEPGDVILARNEFEELKDCKNYINKNTTLAEVESYMSRFASAIKILGLHSNNKMAILSKEIELENIQGTLNPEKVIKNFSKVLSKKMPAYEYSGD